MKKACMMRKYFPITRWWETIFLSYDDGKRIFPEWPPIIMVLMGNCSWKGIVYYVTERTVTRNWETTLRIVPNFRVFISGLRPSMKTLKLGTIRNVFPSWKSLFSNASIVYYVTERTVTGNWETTLRIFLFWGFSLRGGAPKWNPEN